MEPSSGIIGIIVTVGMTVFGFLAWIVRKLFVLEKDVSYVKKETHRLADALEKHELEDDTRFAAISVKLDRLLELGIAAKARLDTYISEQSKSNRKDH